MLSGKAYRRVQGAAEPGALALEVKDLSFSYGGVSLFQEATFSLKAGELAFLQGENGSGKSTLLRCLAGWANPKDGTIVLDGAVFDTSDRALRRKVFFVPDMPVFYDDLTANEHISFVRQANRLEAEGDCSGELMSRFGLASYGDRLPSTFSRGMRMKLALVLALAASPRLLLLDEPYAPLDPDASSTLSELLQSILARGTAIIASCHHEVPRLNPNAILTLSSGSLVRDSR